MISIIIPVYNQGKQLSKCLGSILKQSYDNFEVILVNDRSTQKLSSYVRPFKRKMGLKMEIMNNQTRHGAPYARNKGFKKAKGEFVLFCDADIIMKPEMLETMHNALHSNKEASYAYSAHKYGHKLFKFWPWDADKLRQMPYIHSTSLLRKEHFPRTGWDESLKKLQDWDFFLSVLDEGHSGVWIEEVLFTIIPGGVYSNWLPSAAYSLFPFLPKVKRYNEAMRVVKEKHGLA